MVEGRLGLVQLGVEGMEFLCIVCIVWISSCSSPWSLPFTCLSFLFCSPSLCWELQVFLGCCEVSCFPRLSYVSVGCGWWFTAALLMVFIDLLSIACLSCVMACVGGLSLY